MQKFIIKIDSATPISEENLSEECYLLNDKVGEEYCANFKEKCKDKIMLIYGDNAVETAKKCGADGVVLDLGIDDLKEKMKLIRKTLGKDKVVGLITRNRRHESMLVSEVEPDFVIFKIWKDGFENLKELTDWYADFFLIQSAALIMEDGVDYQNLNTDLVIKELRSDK